MDITILGITGLIYAAFVLSTAFLRGAMGFSIWLVLSVIVITYLKITMQPTSGETISNTWLISPAIIGFFVGLLVHAARIVTRNRILPLILIIAGSLLLINDFGILDAIDTLVRSF